MIRTQIQLDEEQHRKLQALAAAEGGTVSEVIRRSIETLLADSASEPDGAARERARAAAGKFHSGLCDLSTLHD